MLWFNLRSLFTRYGWLFLHRICLLHPIKAFKALLRARKININDNFVSVSVDDPKEAMEYKKRIVGIGFCMKPRNLLCPSNTANHDCYYLERLACSKDFAVPDACRECYIRKTGLASLRANAAFYIMTSAKDILFDVYKPALKKEFEAGYFILCRYSFKPFFVGMEASGIKGCMFPFDKGDCRDYDTWSRADIGEKADRTTLACNTREHIETLIGEAAGNSGRIPKFEKRGNIFYPICEEE